VKRGLFWTAALLAALDASGAADAFRFSRPIEGASGWTRIELPDDVLDACRRGLPDLRIEADTGTEVPYALGTAVQSAESAPRPLTDVESVPKSETTAVLDRGARPPLADRATFAVEGNDFLKPVTAEASDDRSDWKEIARGSIFAAGGTRMLTVRFPPSDRRFLRFRFDDRNGDPIRPTAVVLGAASPAPPPAAERALAPTILPDAPKGTTLARIALPAANLPIRTLRFEADDAAFARPASVYERVLFRDEIRRRLLASGVLTKSPGTAPSIELPSDPVAGRALEIEIADGDASALANLRVTALVEPQTLRFFAPSGARLTLRYGSAAVQAPRYDVEAALRKGAPPAFADARLGPATETAAAPAFTPSLGPAIDPTVWPTRYEIALPAAGGLAYCDLPPDAPPEGVRVVDGENRQVPYLLERSAREVTRTVHPSWKTLGSESVAEISDRDPAAPLEAIEIDAGGPADFSRGVFVEALLRDARGAAGSQPIGGATWERRSGRAPEPLRVPLGFAGKEAIRIRVANGDNPPLALGAVRLVTSVSRIDFAFRPGAKLFLLAGNRGVGAPRYDFALLSREILAAPAERATLGPPVTAERPTPRTPVWLWAAVAAAVLLVGLALTRTLKKS
jgi:hypothetical protein